MLKWVKKMREKEPVKKHFERRPSYAYEIILKADQITLLSFVLRHENFLDAAGSKVYVSA